MFLGLVVALSGCMESQADVPGEPEWVFRPVNKQGILDVPLMTAIDPMPNAGCVILEILNETRLLDLSAQIAWTPADMGSATLRLRMDASGLSPGVVVFGSSPLAVQMPNGTFQEGDRVTVRVDAPNQQVPASPTARQEVQFLVSFTNTQRPGELGEEPGRLQFSFEHTCPR